MNIKIKSVLSKEKVASVLSKEKITSALAKIPMKEKLFAVVSTIPFIAVTTMSGACATACPYGMVNCPYPGQCSRYIDANGDGLCDLSQTTTTDTESADAAATSTDETTTDTTTTDTGHGNGVNADVTPDQPVDANTTIPDSPNMDTGNLQQDGNNYYVLPITLMMIGGYLFTYFLFKKGILKRNKHRRIWNLLVTAGYLGSGLTGVLLTLMINLGIRTALNPSITFWHVELSVLMVIGTLIHLHIYWKPFKNMFKVLFGFKVSKKKDPTRTIGTSK